MIGIKCFRFSPFIENTYILHDETKECIIIDPGCLSSEEQQTFLKYIESNNLNPVKLLNTHAHLDHIFGNNFICSQFELLPLIHKAELDILNSMSNSAMMFGISDFEPSPMPTEYIKAKDKIVFGNSELEVLYVPGHSPGHLAFVHKQQEFVVLGDVLFLGSIGRTDLPGGDYRTLINSIQNQILPLGDDFQVYSGHGDVTTVGYEKMHNPFLCNNQVY